MQYVSERDATRWVEEVLSMKKGTINKEKLDNQRMHETNCLDMMQNTSTIHRPASLTEMQLVCLLLVMWAQ